MLGSKRESESFQESKKHNKREKQPQKERKRPSLCMKICCESNFLSILLAFGIFNEKLSENNRARRKPHWKIVFYEFLIKLKALWSFKALIYFNV